MIPAHRPSPTTVADAADARPATRVATASARSLEEFAELVRGSFMPLRLTSQARDFRGVIRTASRDDVHCYEVIAPAHVVERTPELIARTTTGEFYKISLMLAGTSLIMQDGREAHLRTGDLALYDTTRPYTLVSDEGSRTAVVMIPRQLVDLTPGLVGQLTAVRVDGRRGLGAIVAPLVASLAADLGQLDTPAGARLARHVVDVITTLLIGELDAGTESLSRRTLMRRICAWIDEHLGDPDLSPAAIAGAHFISTRYLQDLFQREGTTVSAWVRQRRLERCRRDLTDPVRADVPIASIASSWGFVEPTHFSRVFREHFGRSPREARAMARLAG